MIIIIIIIKTNSCNKTGERILCNSWEFCDVQVGSSVEHSMEHPVHQAFNSNGFSS